MTATTQNSSNLHSGMPFQTGRIFPTVSQICRYSCRETDNQEAFVHDHSTEQQSIHGNEAQDMVAIAIPYSSVESTFVACLFASYNRPFRRPIIIEIPNVFATISHLYRICLLVKWYPTTATPICPSSAMASLNCSPICHPHLTDIQLDRSCKLRLAATPALGDDGPRRSAHLLACLLQLMQHSSWTLKPHKNL